MATCGECPWRHDDMAIEPGETYCFLCDAIAKKNGPQCRHRKAFRVVRDAYRRKAKTLSEIYGLSAGIRGAAELQRGFMVAHYSSCPWADAHDRVWKENESLKADNTRLRNLLGEWNDE